MHEMIKGANVGLTSLSTDVGSVMVSLGWSSPTGEGDADVSVLLLTADGRVRSDADAGRRDLGGPRGTLERLRPEPADMLPRNGAQITGFRLSLFRGMGNTRGNAESGFIRSVDDSVDRFHSSVVENLDRRAPRPRQPVVGAAAG
ncbi:MULTISPECIES: TerD family protein [unclassified Streptomyces]|uniref:TerD family protein n=1 Tax=Streptomyces sp. 039-1 TaxID=2789263 RepID=UPI0039F5AF20